MIEDLYHRFPLFSQFSEKQFRKFISKLSERKYRPGEYIVRQGETSPNAHFLIQGRAEVFSGSNDGDLAHILFYRAPSLFGIIEIWDESPYLGTVMALEPSTTLIMNKAQYLSLLHESHQACLTLIKYLADTVYESGVDHRVRLFGQTEHVIANFLLRQAEACGEEMHGGFYLPASINKSRISKALGVSRRHTIECFRIIEEKKLIDVQKGNMFIPNLEKLREFSDSVWKYQEKHNRER